MPATQVDHHEEWLYRWEEDAEDESLTSFSVHIFPPFGQDEVMDFGQMADTITGMLNLAIDYPHMELACYAEDDYESGLEILAELFLSWYR